MGLIKYAGYDPSENKFVDRRLEERFGRREIEIDPRRAEELKAKGLRWREVAVLLSHECRRRALFQPQSVATAVYQSRRVK